MMLRIPRAAFGLHRRCAVVTGLVSAPLPAWETMVSATQLKYDHSRVDAKSSNSVKIDEWRTVAVCDWRSGFFCGLGRHGWLSHLLERSFPKPRAALAVLAGNLDDIPDGAFRQDGPGTRWIRFSPWPARSVASSSQNAWVDSAEFWHSASGKPPNAIPKSVVWWQG